jgi:hypothetical protein
VDGGAFVFLGMAEILGLEESDNYFSKYGAVIVLVKVAMRDIGSPPNNQPTHTPRSFKTV